jgi:hypothetical protein
MDKLELAERCEKATGPDRALDWEIHCCNGLEGVGAYGPHPTYTASLDAALTLVDDRDASGILHEAWSRLGDAHALHVRFWKAEDGSYAQALARFVTAAALRAREGGKS